MSSTFCLNDESFGPAVRGCRGDFDFTQKFERIVLSIIPASVFSAFALARIAVLYGRHRIVGGNILKYIKLTTWGIFAVLQLTILVLLLTRGSGVVHGLSIAAAALILVSATIGIPLSYLEHANAVKPSALIGSFLCLTTLFDIAQSRTMWMSIVSSGHGSVVGLFVASVGTKVVLICLEGIPKTRWMDWNPSERSPEESMNMYTHGVWSWLNRLLLQGNRSILDVDSLYALDSRIKAARLYEKLDKQRRTKGRRRDPRYGLLKDLFRTLTGPFLLPIAPRLAFTGFKFCQPLLINTTLQYLSSERTPGSENIGYGLIGAAALVYIMIAISNGFYSYWNIKALYQTRGCLSAAIYRKTVEAKLTTAGDSAALTLMSTDIEQIVLGGAFVHTIWASVLEVAIGLWLLENQIGIAFLAPIATIACSSIVTFGLSPLMRRRQKAWMEAIQHRVGLTANAIANMKLYKLSGMAATVADHIQALRVEEITIGKRMRWLSIVCACMSFVPSALAPTFTFAVTARELDLSTIFTSLAYILLVADPLNVLFQVYPSLVSALACLQRIQKFLDSEPRTDYRLFSDYDEKSDDKMPLKAPQLGTDAFAVRGGAAGWSPDNMSLRGININIPAAELTLIVGPVASGKSTFCKVLLGEIPFFSGTLSVHFPPQSIAYCEQVPFLYNASLKDNIIGQVPFDQQRFDDVINATLLDTDIAVLPHGIDTKVGSDGIMLSGGQRQRVSVARALYSDANVLVFDDVLSGLDKSTDAKLFRRVFASGGLLRKRGATAIVCTHSIGHLPEADHIIAFGPDGTVIEQGKFSDLKRNENYIQSLGVQSNSQAVDAQEEPQTVDPGTAKEVLREGTMINLHEKARQTGDWSVYSYWFKNVHPIATAGLAFGSVFHGFLENFATIWLKYWSENTFNKGNGFYIGILGLIRSADLLILTMVVIMVLIVMITFAGSRLHLAAIQTVSSAPLSFFTSTDTGTLTNLFSQDMTMIDGALLMAMINFCLYVPEALGAAAVIAAASPYLAIGYPFVIGVIYFIQNFYLRTSRQLRLLDLEAKSPLYTNFLDTMKGLATIRAYGWPNQLVQKNDVLLDTSQRPAYLLPMIQEWLSLVMQLLVAVLATILFALATQLRTGAGLTGASLLTLLSLGTALFQLIRSYTQLETCLGAVNRLRTFSTTVKPEDQPGEDIVPTASWPRGGCIEIRKMSAKYRSDNSLSQQSWKDDTVMADDNCVLRDISLSIRAGEKVALCGRTGSGKSSLILVLARLLDPLPSCADSIHIDGLSLRRVQRKALRERIIAIPQDAVFLPDGSSVRMNLDPFGAATAEECLSVFQAVRLLGFVNDRGGLEAGMSADDLSAGQKQLFSLGRAILRKQVRARTLGDQAAGGLLLLDEVSSNVDKDTDREMQEIIKVEFAAYTIVMVSHRLQMVVDYFDRVVILDKGVIVETGAPADLLKAPASRFGGLWAIGNHENLSDSSSSSSSSEVGI